jgi:hypothetical protein
VSLQQQAAGYAAAFAKQQLLDIQPKGNEQRYQPYSRRSA